MSSRYVERLRYDSSQTWATCARFRGFYAPLSLKPRSLFAPNYLEDCHIEYPFLNAQLEDCHATFVVCVHVGGEILVTDPPAWAIASYVCLQYFNHRDKGQLQLLSTPNWFALNNRQRRFFRRVTDITAIQCTAPPRTGEERSIPSLRCLQCPNITRPTGTKSSPRTPCRRHQFHTMLDRSSGQ